MTLLRGGGEARKVVVGESVRSGDRLSAPGGASATLFFFPSGPRERLLPGKTATVQRGGCTPGTAVKRSEVPVPNAQDLRGLPSLGGTGKAAGTVFRDPLLPEGTLPAVTPMYGTRITSDKPRLSWQPLRGATGYRVQLLGSERRVLWAHDTRAPSLLFPAKEKALRPGTSYEWTVTAILPGGKTKALAESKFLVANAGQRKNLATLEPLRDSKDPADLLLAAAGYQAARAFEEALQVYERLARLSPNEPLFQAALADYYERAGRTEDAAQALERAKKLGYTMPAK